MKNKLNATSALLLGIILIFIGHSSISKDITNPKVKWTFKTQGTIRSSVAISGDYLYFGSADGFIYALNKTNGSLRWKFETKRAIGTPALTNDLVIFTSRDNYVYALHSNTGELAWKFQMQSILNDYTEWEYFTSAPVVTGTTVLVGSGDSNLYALDIANGKLLWKYKTGGRIRATPLVDNKIIYQPGNDGIVYVLSVRDGMLLWSFKTEGASLDRQYGYDRTNIFTTPRLKNNLLCFGSRDGNTYAVDITTHKQKWAFTYGGTWAMSTAADDQTIFAGWSTNNTFCAIDLNTGGQKWKYECGAMIYTTAALHNDEVVFGSADGNLYSLNKNTGKKNWQFTTGWEIHSSPVYEDSTIYFGCDDGFLYALEEGNQVYTAVYQPLVNPDKSTYPLIDPKISPYLHEQGFKQLDSAQLYQFVSDRIHDKALSVIVFAYDAIPKNIMGDTPENSMIRKYLDAGGKIIWFGWIPNLFPFDTKGKPNGNKDTSTASRLLDVHFDRTEDSGNYYSRATQEGLNWGLPVWFKATYAVVSPEKVIPLAYDEYNRVSVWMKKFNARAGSGFISCRTWSWDVPMKEEDLKMIYHLAVHELK